jgi:tetratricopeptide (TPR) repeat protein
MFMARQEPPARQTARNARWQSTLERRYDFHLGEAIRATLEGSHDKAAGHSGMALSISRELYAHARDQARHRPGLAAALASHARWGGVLDAVALLTESAGHYAALASIDPDAYEVPRIDVLTRVALAADAAGNTKDAIRLLREVAGMYQRAPAADPAERDLGLARVRFHLGRCLVKTGAEADGLAETEAGLELAGRAVELNWRGDDWREDDWHENDWRGDDWLDVAPRPVQVAALDWLAAAVHAMTLHSAAGRWDRAARAARAAVRVSAGLAALGGDAQRRAHEALLARARAVLACGSDATARSG